MPRRSVGRSEWMEAVELVAGRTHECTPRKRIPAARRVGWPIWGVDTPHGQEIVGSKRGRRDTMPLMVRDLPAEALARLRVLRFDLSVQKHEGPWSWEPLLDPERRTPEERAEVWTEARYAALLPLARTNV